MSATNQEIVFLIIAVIAVLLFLGILFLVTLVYSANKRKQAERERQLLISEFNKLLLQSKLEMQEQTFSFISQEIHDNVGQVLSLAKVQLSILDEGAVFNRDLIQQAKESVGKVMVELRDIAKSLSTDRIQAFDLCRSIEEEVYRINKTGALHVLFTQQGQPLIQDAHKLILFRVIQEGLQNTVKHAKAKTITISLTATEGDCHIRLSDDGTGFNVNTIREGAAGLGLKNMQQRIALIGGSLALHSEVGNGTIIDIKLSTPCNISPS